MHLGLDDPLCPMSTHGSPVALLKLQIAPKLILLISSGSKKKEPRCVCLSEAKASHSQRMWAEVSSSTTHLLHSGMSARRIVLCRKPVTILKVCLNYKQCSINFNHT
jgi:hypothetical protein